VVAVTFYFQMIAILIGLWFAALVQPVSFVANLSGVLALLSLYEVAASLAKALAFGLVIAATSCYYGLSARGTVTAVPRAATAAVMRNLVTVFLLDGVLTYAFFF
jgi:phospholipid/cholesterol/gamma-HCH transport system permease protein